MRIIGQYKVNHVLMVELSLIETKGPVPIVAEAGKHSKYRRTQFRMFLYNNDQFFKN